MDAIFWIALLLVIFIYLGYPLTLLRGRKSLSTIDGDKTNFPTVTIVIPAYNESGCIEKTIQNKFSCNYPHQALSIIVVSDDSDDGTNEIVERIIEDSPVKMSLLKQSPRQGKTAAVNMAVGNTQADILIFSDANSIYHPDAIKHLVNRLCDSNVGYVTGKMVYTNPDGTVSGVGCSAYMRYENMLRELENEAGSVIGVDGGIDAMWRKDFTLLEPEQLPDFVQPLHIISKGLKVVYESRSILYEEVTTSATSEYRMRVRVALRAYWALWDMRHLLNPFRYGFVSYQLWLHKVLRYLVFILMLVMLVTNTLLIHTNALYWLAILGQITIYLIGLWVQFRRPLKPPIIMVACNYFCLINLASAHAFLRFIRRKKLITWQPRVG